MPEETPERRLSLRVVTLPRDTNIYGTIFGGVILSYIDQAGFVEARTHGCHRWVTASVDRVDFSAPVHLGDVVAFYTSTMRTGRSSVCVRVEVDAERFGSGESVRVTEATVTLVAIDEMGKPIAFATSATVTPPA